MMNRQTQRYIKRMQNVVRALEEAPEPDNFSMQMYGHPCGAPACVLGHYAARTDLQKTFTLDAIGDVRTNDGSLLGSWQNNACPHFGISSVEAFDLFDSDGCDFAQTPAEAIAYVKEFIIKKWGTK